MNQICRIFIFFSIIIIVTFGCSKDPEKSFDEINNNAVSLFQEKKYEESIDECNEAINLARENFDPNSPRLATALFNQACNYFMLKEYNLARPLFNQALQINKNYFGKNHPEVVKIINYQALMYYQERNFSEAIVSYKKAYDITKKTIGDHPSLAIICNNMGAIYNIQGLYDKADECYQTALKFRPDDPYLKEARSVIERDRKNIDATIAGVKEELEKRGGNHILSWRLGNLYKSKNLPEEALKYYEKALSSKRQYPEALSDAAELYMEKGDYEKALEYYNEAVKLRPSQYDFFYNISRIYARKGNSLEAVKWLKTAVENGYYNWEFIQNDKYMDDIRKTSEYKEMEQAAAERTASSASKDSV